MRVLLINQGHTDNLGDRAISQVMSEIVRRTLNADITVMPFIPDEQTVDLAAAKTRQVESNDEPQISALRKVSRTIKRQLRNLGQESLGQTYKRIIRSRVLDGQFDLAIIGGGELIKGNRHPFYYSLQAWVTVLTEIGCPVRVLGVSCDKKFTRQEQRVLHETLSKCDAVMVRDKPTLRTMTDTLQVNCTYAPDVVFSYRYMHQENDEDHLKRTMDGVCVYAYRELSEQLKNQYDHDGYYEYWYQRLQSHSSGIVSLLYTTYSDYCESVRFRKWLADEKGLEVALAQINDVDDYIAQVCNCLTLVSGRMHSMIFALQYGVAIEPVPIKAKLAIFGDEWKDVRFRWQDEGKAVYDAYVQAVNQTVKA